MEFVAKSSIVNTAPRKIKAVADKIKGMSLDQSLLFLSFWPKKAAGVLRGALLSAVNNAKGRAGLKKEELKIKTVQVEAGSTQKRMRPRAKGQGDTIKRRTARIRVVVEELRGER